MVILSAEEAGDVNTIVLKSSPALSVPLGVGTWAFESLIVVNGGAGFATAGTRQKLHFTGTGTFAGSYYTVDNGAAVSSAYPSNRQALAVNTEHLASANSSATLRIGTIVVTGPGLLVVQYAQRTATAAANPGLAVASYLRVTPV